MIFFRKISRLQRALTEMQESLEGQLKEMKAERNRLSTILEAMIEGVLVVDAGGKILLCNASLQSMLQLDQAGVGWTVLECVRNRQLEAAIGKVLKTGNPDEQEIVLLQNGEERSLIVHTAPLLKNLEVNGAVCVLHDVTHLLRKEFVANVSHELKTPLTVIRGYAETLKGGGWEEKETAVRFLEKIEGGAVQLQHLVEDLLRLSEVESGRAPMNVSRLALLPIVEEIRSHRETALRQKQMHFETGIAADCSVLAEPVALRQILGNLLDNAIQYTPAQGSITIAAQSKNAMCEVSVRDTGIGISEKDLPRIFERFYRVDKARSREMGGTGLGLAIVKHWVAAHGGEVGVESRPGEGSRFFFTLPC